MRVSFEALRREVARRPGVTDPRGNRTLIAAYAAIQDSASASAALAQADEKRLGSAADLHEAAYVYLALGIRLSESPAIELAGAKGAVRPAQLFHFAGHAFRDSGQMNRAADAYRRAGIASDDGGSPDAFGIRSLARAKMCYAEIGETDRSDEMHVLEWEARRRKARVGKPLLSVWKWTSGYGTSPRAWLLWVLGFVVLFTLLYEWLHRRGLLCAAHGWTPFLTAAYYCVVTTATVGYGEIVPCNGPAAQAVVTLHIVAAYILLAIGATILGRKVLGR